MTRSDQRKLPEGIVEAQLGDIKVQIREKDKWINATNMAQAVGTRKHIAHMEKRLGTKVIELGNGIRTFIHPDLAPNLLQWTQIPKRTKEESYVYIASSPHLKFVKIGMWTSLLSTLLKRYRTFYGSSLTIHAWDVVENAKDAETDVHKAFAEARLENELFDLKCKDDVALYLTELYGMPHILDRDDK